MRRASPGPAVLVGFPELGTGGVRHNAVAILREGRVVGVCRKRTLPNYTVFDEQRYFTPGTEPCVFDVAGVRVGVVICEDIWFPEPARLARDAGAQLVVVPNGSPYHTRQQAMRREVVVARAVETKLPIVYVNRVGGQDELVFDGASFVVDGSGNVAQQLPAWHETVALAEFDGAVPKAVRGDLDARLEPHVYAALTMGVRDYVEKNRFPGVLLGLVRWRRFGADLGGRRRCARPRPRASADAALAVQCRDQPRGRAHDGGHSRRALRRDSDR